MLNDTTSYRYLTINNYTYMIQRIQTDIRSGFRHLLLSFVTVWCLLGAKPMQIFISKSRFKKVLHCGCLYKCQYTELWLSKRFPPVQKFWILESFPATSLQRINFPWAVCNSPQIGLLSKIPSHPLPPPLPPPHLWQRNKYILSGGRGVFPSI